MPTETLTREIFGNIGTVPKMIFYALAVIAGLIVVNTAWPRIRRWRSGRAGDSRHSAGQTVRAIFARVLSQSTLDKTRPAACSPPRPGRARLCRMGALRPGAQAKK